MDAAGKRGNRRPVSAEVDPIGVRRINRYAEVVVALRAWQQRRRSADRRPRTGHSVEAIDTLQAAGGVRHERIQHVGVVGLDAERNSTTPTCCMRSWRTPPDRKSTRLNSSHPSISYAVFCLKK